MKEFLMLKLILSICILILISCSDNSNGFNPISQNTKNYTLTWTPPTNFENGDLLVPLNDLSEYRVYYGDSRQNVTQNVTVLTPDKRSFTTKGLDQNLINSFSVVYMAMTSVSKDGVESVLSSIVPIP